MATLIGGLTVFNGLAVLRDYINAIIGFRVALAG